jgi:hypothetical protein
MSLDISSEYDQPLASKCSLALYSDRVFAKQSEWGFTMHI